MCEESGCWWLVADEMGAAEFLSHSAQLLVVMNTKLK